MATRDKAVGVAFSKSNVYQLYRKAKAENIQNTVPSKTALNPSTLKPSSRVIRSEDIDKAGVIKFKPTPLKEIPFQEENKIEVKTEISYFSEKDLEMKSVEELQENFKKLQNMHSKLKFMLKELEDLVNKKK